MTIAFISISLCPSAANWLYFALLFPFLLVKVSIMRKFTACAASTAISCTEGHARQAAIISAKGNTTEG
jgi:hypothetical protein